MKDASRAVGVAQSLMSPDLRADFVAKTEVKSPRSVKDRHPSALEVPSRIAEQLFWVGRYAERIELSTRLLRVTLRHMIGETGRFERDQAEALGESFAPLAVTDTCRPASSTRVSHYAPSPCPSVRA